MVKSARNDPVFQGVEAEHPKCQLGTDEVVIVWNEIAEHRILEERPCQRGRHQPKVVAFGERHFGHGATVQVVSKA